jgi:hypothetical protein
MSLSMWAKIAFTGGGLGFFFFCCASAEMPLSRSARIRNLTTLLLLIVDFHTRTAITLIRAEPNGQYPQEKAVFIDGPAGSRGCIFIFSLSYYAVANVEPAPPKGRLPAPHASNRRTLEMERSG